ncbi:MAG: DUF4136 domain-containing protein [Candidatus Krumholzibacteria bacterium]|nr:DUF4136 domain-containing protein [Candidatus Krumholzibacteria bacterium]
MNVSKSPRWTVSALAVVIALTAGCSGMSISSDYDPGKIEEMKAYKTYAWFPAPREKVRGGSQLVGKRVQYVADQVLQDKGYQLAGQTAPDFMIGWHAALDKKLNYSTVNSYYGYGWGYWGGTGYSQTYVTEYKVGTLLIDIVDASDNELAWRGTASAEVYPQADEDYRNRQIESAVRKMLDRFPPKK